MENFTSTASIVITVLIFAEFIYSFFKKSKSYDIKDSTSNIVIGIMGSMLMKLLWNGLMVGGFTVCYQLSWFRLNLSEAAWWYWPLALLLSDFSYYWYHRLGHEVRLLWGTHSIHHSSEDYNLSTSVRLSWIESSFRWVFWVPLPLLGYDPVSSLIAYYIIRYYQVWLHTEKINKIPVIDRIFTVPSHHRVHHGTNPQYIDKNYGGCLIIWDKLFGTFQEEEEPVVYGVLKPIQTYNPITINFGEYQNLFWDVVKEPSWKNKMQYMLRKPGWSPHGQGESEAELFKNKLALGYGRRG